MILISPYVIVWPWLWAGSTHNSPSIATTSSTAQGLSLSCQGFLFWCCEVDSISNSLGICQPRHGSIRSSIGPLYRARSEFYPCLQVYQMHHNSLKASKADYVEHVLPSLKPVMKMMEPIQILLIFMQVAYVYIFLYSKSLWPENGPSSGENPSRGCSQRCSADGLQGPRVGSFSNTGALPFHNSQFCR